MTKRRFIPYTNRPPHIFLDETYYFITARTIDKIHYFNTSEKKKILLKIFQNVVKRFNYSFQAWVILDNHYHIMIKTKIGKDVPKFIGTINANSARELNRYDNKIQPSVSPWSPIRANGVQGEQSEPCYKGRKVWWNYWDRCMRSRKDFWTHVNYIHHNSIKHNYVKEMADYQLSSYDQYLKKFGQEFLTSSFKDFPIIDFTDKSDDF